jgi:hypothetical protein
MADDIRTVLKFVGDAKDAQATIDGLVVSLRKAAADTKKLFDDVAKGPTKTPQFLPPGLGAEIDKTRRSVLALAQAEARLFSAQGDLAGAQKTLSTALAGIAEKSVATVRAQTQLVGINAQLSTAAGKAETSLLREAQAIARLQQISGNTPAAIKTLGDALERVSNRSSLPALRAELQKTYLDTNYANSPLISAIDRINAGLRLASPLLGGTAGNLSQLITVSAGAAQAISTAGRGLDAGAKSASNFAANVANLRSGLKTFLSDQKGEANLSLGLGNVLRGIEGADFGRLRQEASAAFGSIRSGALSAAEGIGRITLGVGLVAGALTGILAIGAAGFFGAIGGRALDAAKEVDAARQSIAALVGGADAANAKLAELRQLAQQSPGVTTGLATTLFSQLKATSDIADASINKIIQSVGKLNAVFTIDDPKSFSRNLVQIFTQGFERADIKEALGRVPIFEQFLESAFGTKDAGKLRQLKDAGKLTLESFLGGLAEAINTDARFANVRESLGAQFAKAADNITFALAPIGDEIAKILLPVIARIQPQIEAAAQAIANELAQAQDEFKLLADVTAEFLATLGDIGSSTGLTFDLQEELRTIAALIEFITGGVRFLQDVAEIAIATAVTAIKGLTLVIEQTLAGALSIVGIEIQALADDIKRLEAESAASFGRIVDGLKNTREFNAQRRFDPFNNGFLLPDKDGVVDFGGAQTGPQKTIIPPRRSSSTTGTADRNAKARRSAAERAAREEAQAELAILRQKEAALELSARRNLDGLRQSLTDRLVSQETFAELSIRVERELLTQKLAILKQEEEAAVRTTKNKTAAEAKRAEFAQKAARETQETDLRTENLRDEARRIAEKAEEDHQKRLVDIREIGRRSIEKAIDEQVRLNQIGAVTGAERQIEIERERFADREVLLRREIETARENIQERQRLNDELAKLAAERVAFEEDASRRISEAQEQEARHFRESVQARAAALQSLKDAQLQLRQAEADKARGQFGTRNDGAREQFRIDQERLQLQRANNERAIREQFEQAEASARAARLSGTVLQQIEIEKNAALEAERQRHNLALQQLLNQQFAFEQQAASAVRGLFSQRVNELSEDLGLFRANLSVFAQELEDSIVPIDEIGKRAFEGFAQGIGSVVEQYVLLGKTGPAVIRKLLAAQLAAIAAEAAINAIKQLALGFAALFLNPPEAAGHFTSAALWAGLAAGSGLIGRAIAPGQGGGASGGGSAASPPSGGSRVIEQGGPLPSSRPSETVVKIHLSPGLIAQEVIRDISQNGQIRAAIRDEIQTQ